MERGFDFRRLHQFPFINPVPGRGLWLDLFVRDIVKKGAEVCSRIDSNCWIQLFSDTLWSESCTGSSIERFNSNNRWN